MFSRPNATSLSTRVITTWFSGSWKTDDDDARQLGRAVRPRVEAADLDPAGEAAAVKVRHEPRQRAQERRLAAAGRSEQGDDLARVELEREITYRRHAARVGEREPLDAR